MDLRNRIKGELDELRQLLSPGRAALLLLGTAILAFGLVNIHRRVGITEGGVLGMVLLLDHHLGAPPWLINPLLDAACYLLGWRYLGWNFIKLSAVSTLGVAGFLRLWQQLPPVLPDLTGAPLLAALLGGLCVGVGVGLVVRQGGSSGGDDALALVIAQRTGCRLSRAYLVTDLTVLALSLSYIPLRRIAYSLITVTVSSLLIDLIQRVGKRGRLAPPAGEPARDSEPPAS